MSCSVCRGEAGAHNSFRHKECGHLTHADCCNPAEINYKLCNACLNPYEEPWPEIPEGDPHPGDGHDYVLEPGARTSTAWSAVTSLIGKRTAVNPLDMLQKRTPVDVMMKKHKIGLHHILQAGGDIMDFLSNGYTWNDLLKYEDVSKKGPERALHTMHALGLSASHLRTYPNELPWESLKKHMELDTGSLYEHFGLHFPAAGQPIQCQGDNMSWNAFDLIKLGVTMDDLMSFGMTHVDQYQDLMEGLTKKRANEAEQKLGTTSAHLNELILEEEEEVQPVVAPPAAPKMQKAVPEESPLAIPPVGNIIPKYMQTYNQRKLRHGTVK